MAKREDFLWAVQTIMLANSVQLASQPERAEAFRHEIGAGGMISNIYAALEAADRIPQGMSAADAAKSFCATQLSNIRDQTAPLTPPAWLDD